uniref:RING-type domain-containing protein n=1 Tax=Chromera velia CCMP2878 TaxID=1169474 RepID=A0A0G4IBZ8_9ALVE|eukprot:Cvel_2224.t1-p1 / transcript=Cvel_2224.t1 / gene=Cvel_2224 / organism=Chromera_velia_CCMP2878 / gene_product=Calcium/calmodulin-dependent 3',5'-cyclic, putative / transcript_product=Calcium/calmodulin-dependent 3',5'-cyclic, putative / location=Cvel_scaffold86:9429-13782(+) / protein_length=785 / sequence_SO=supercontig / SO=protein_coding / is_pseudo=false
MNHIATEITIIVLVFGYLLLVFAILLFQEDFDEKTLFALNVVDLIILCLCSVEISLKTFAVGVRYIRDWWNILDAVIVLISLVLSAVTMALSGNEDLQRYSRIRGVLRLLRVMVIFRRVSETRSSLHRLRQMDLTLATPLEKCTYLLARIEHDRMVPQNRRQDAKTVAETLARGDLFEPVQADVDDRDDLAFKTEASAWLSTAKQKTTENGKLERSPTHFARVKMRREGIQHRDQSMLGEGGEGGENDDFFILTAAGGDGPDSPMHSQDPTAKGGGALVGQDLSMVPGAVPTSPLVMRQTMDSVDKWTFDVFALEELTDGHSLSCLLFHLSKKHSLTDAFQLPGPQWRNLTLSVEAGYRKENSYRNSMHAADVLQGTYFLLTGGEVSDREPPSVSPPVTRPVRHRSESRVQPAEGAAANDTPPARGEASASAGSDGKASEGKHSSSVGTPGIEKRRRVVQAAAEVPACSASSCSSSSARCPPSSSSAPDPQRSREKERERESGWFHDLTKEGVEPNPGPGPGHCQEEGEGLTQRSEEEKPFNPAKCLIAQRMLKKFRRQCARAWVKKRYICAAKAECPICLQQFRYSKHEDLTRQARVLKCGHSVCCECIPILRSTGAVRTGRLRLLKPYPKRKFQCPVCRAPQHCAYPTPINYSLMAVVCQEIEDRRPDIPLGMKHLISLLREIRDAPQVLRRVWKYHWRDQDSAEEGHVIVEVCVRRRAASVKPYKIQIPDFQKEDAEDLLNVLLTDAKKLRDEGASQSSGGRGGAGGVKESQKVWFKWFDLL